MTVEIKYVFEDAGDAAAFLISVQKTIDNAGKGDEKAKSDPKPTKAAAAPAPAKDAATSPTAATSPAAAPAPAEAAKVDLPTYEKSGIPEKIATCASPATGKRAEVVALLAEFGAKKGGDLKSEQFAAFTVKIDALLAAEAPLS